MTEDRQMAKKLQSKKPPKKLRSKKPAMKKRAAVSRSVPAQTVLEQLPMIKLLARTKGSDAVKGQIVRAGGIRLADAVCSICKNLEAGTIKSRKRLTLNNTRLVRQLARGGPAARKRLSQKGGLPILPIVAALAPSILGLIGKGVGALVSKVRRSGR